MPRRNSGWLEGLRRLFRYGHLPGYLHRWKLLRAGRFMVRVHRILSPDGTPFLHSHPFDYVSFVLWGGYRERVLQCNGTLCEVDRGPGHLVARRATTLHRIDQVRRGGCWTLFLARARPGPAQGWELQRHPQVEAPAGYWDAADGIYRDAQGFRARRSGRWYAKRGTIELAQGCARLSLHQALQGLEPVGQQPAPIQITP